MAVADARAGAEGVPGAGCPPMWCDDVDLAVEAAHEVVRVGSPARREDNELHETVVVPGADPWWTRTNILIENDYVDRIMSRYGLVTKTEAVDLALRHLAGDPMTLDEALAMRGAHAIDDLPAETPPPGTR